MKGSEADNVQSIRVQSAGVGSGAKIAPFFFDDLQDRKNKRFLVRGGALGMTFEESWRPEGRRYKTGRN
jgi:hypothetical protein